MTEMKKCTKCLEEKPKTLDYFYKGKIQLRAKCKKCCYIETHNNPNYNSTAIKFYNNNKELCNKRDRIYKFKKATGIALDFLYFF
jgi:hypothetical protein